MAMVQMVVPGSLPIGHLLQAWFSPLNFNIADNAPKLLPLIFALLIARILEKAMFPKQVSLGLNGQMIYIKMAENWEGFSCICYQRKEKKSSTK